MKDFIKRNLPNIPGMRLKRKIVLIESDDWGSIRMPSKETYVRLKNDGYNLDADPYMRYDSLATADDLSQLFEVLRSVKDRNGNHPVFTANTIVANPDFEKIKAGNFGEFHYEKFTDTLSRYKNCENSFALWQEGISENIFFPQFHGREHLNVREWMNSLREGDPLVRKAFENGMISISSEPSKFKFSYMEGMDYFDEEGYDARQASLEEGFDLFSDIFGFDSASYIANCYVWDNFVEDVLYKKGVKFLQGVRVQKVPQITADGHKHVLKSNYFGKKNHNGQQYTVRNVFFEPSQITNKDNVSDSLKRIRASFAWGKPAIISTHRINFIGSIDEKNRIDSLRQFKDLLQRIVKEWPDVEFMTIEGLGKLMK